MPSLFAKAALLGTFASTTLAHGTVTGFLTDDTYNQGYLLQYYYEIQNGQTPPTHYGWYAEDLDNGFVSPDNYTGGDIICHKNAKPGNASTATIEAGGKVTFQWTTWPDSHIGPVLTYVANCNGECDDVDKTTLKWVKIDESGYDVDTKTWAATSLIANNNSWVTTVPSTLAAGNYVFRHEIIALHGAESENGAQNYPQCVNIAITGSGTDNPEGTLGTELYTPTDAGILFNPYTTITSYEIPGPTLYGSGSGSGSNSTTSPSSSASQAVSSASATSAAASSVAATSTAPSSATSAAVLSAVVSSASVAPVESDAPTVTISSVTVVTAIATTAVTVSPADATSVAASSVVASSVVASSVASATSAAAQPTSTGSGKGSGSSNNLPKEFTLDTFIAWLKKQGQSSGVARRHARHF